MVKKGKCELKQLSIKTGFVLNKRKATELPLGENISFESLNKRNI